VFVVACLGALAGIRFFFGGVAPTPSAFAAGTSLDQALAESAATGRPVLALATADWCGPCQAFKRGALADEGVAAWIGAHTVPVLVDLTDEGAPGAQEAARLLMVESIPALVMLREGEVVDRVAGVLSRERLMAWLEAGPAGRAGSDAGATPKG